MQPQYNRTKTNIIMTVILFIAGLWIGMFLSLPAQKGYTYIEWQKDLEEIYKPMLKENIYGITNPLWWKPYVNEYTARFIVITEMLIMAVLTYCIYFAGNYIHGKEFGTAKYENPFKVSAALRSKNTPEEKIYKEKIKRRWLLF